MSAVAELLEKAAEKISQPGAWCQGAFALNEAGNMVWPEEPEARSWCGYGAVYALALSAYPGSVVEAAFSALHMGLPGGVGFTSGFNDLPGQTAENVAAYMRRIAAVQRALEVETR